MTYSTELWHYGVKGQKKGVRRYQNMDGSLTSDGRSHYGIQERPKGVGTNAPGYAVKKRKPMTLRQRRLMQAKRAETIRRNNASDRRHRIALGIGAAGTLGLMAAGNHLVRKAAINELRRSITARKR